MEELWRDSNIYYNLFCFLINENEKLFDRSDAKLYWRTVFHIFCMYHHVYIAFVAFGFEGPIEAHPNPDIRCLNSFRTGYITGWSFAFQTVFLILSLVYDILEWRRNHDNETGVKTKYWRDVIYCGVVVPYTAFVTSMFWVLYAIDRELVFPRIYDEIIPWWFNHCVHTNISVLVILETIVQPRRKPMNKKLESILYWIVGILYAVVYYSIYFITNRFLYQVFGVMNWWQICLYQLLIWFGGYAVYLIQFPISRLIHGSETELEISKELTNKETKNTERETNTTDIQISGDKINEKLTDLKNAPSITKSWSLKFRNIRDQFESSSL